MVWWSESEVFPAIIRMSAPGPGTHDMPVDLLIIGVVIDMEVGKQGKFHVRYSNLLLVINLVAANPIIVSKIDNLYSSVPKRNSMLALMARQEVHFLQNVPNKIWIDTSDPKLAGCSCLCWSGPSGAFYLKAWAIPVNELLIAPRCTPDQGNNRVSRKHYNI
jgi:hypothetical protein